MKAHQPNATALVPAPSFSERTRGMRLLQSHLHQSLSIVLLVASAVTCFAQAGMVVDPASTAAQGQSSPAAGASIPAPLAPPSASQNRPSAPAPLQASANSTLDSAHYVIGADDNLQITVWREPSLSGVLPVRPDGMISLVLIGDLKAAGKTPTQLSDDIAQRLKKYIQDPSVTVAVTAVNSQRIFMVGEIGHVGPVSMSPGMTPLQAISSAGGPSPYANLKRIYILRGLGAKQQKIPFNYKQALKGDNRQDITLQPGDTIVVP